MEISFKEVRIKMIGQVALCEENRFTITSLYNSFEIMKLLQAVQMMTVLE